MLYEDILADLDLETVTRDDFLEWRDRLIEGRQPRTVNRHARSVMAALNQAVELGYLGNPAAWKLKALSDEVEEGGETAVFLDAAHRKAVVAAASPAAGRFFRGLKLTGARPKELAATVVADFDGRTLRLAHSKGRPAKLRPRHVVLSAEAIEFFKKQSKDKLRGAPLFAEDGETPWRRRVWAREMQAAIARHNEVAKGNRRISGHATAYSFRHARISELLQLYGVDPLTVAAQTGTSLGMIEKAYLRFIPPALQEKLAALKGWNSGEIDHGPHAGYVQVRERRWVLSTLGTPAHQSSRRRAESPEPSDSGRRHCSIATLGSSPHSRSSKSGPR